MLLLGDKWYHLNTFIQIELQMKTIEAMKISERAMMGKCCNKSRLDEHSTCSKAYIYIYIHEIKREQV